MRIDVLRSKIRSGEYVLLDGHPPIPDYWREQRRNAMGSNLTCLDLYLRQDKDVRDICQQFDVHRSLVEIRIRAAVKFMTDYLWIVERSPGEQPQPDSVSSLGGGQ